MITTPESCLYYTTTISRYYDLDENYYPNFWANNDEDMFLFAFINHADPTKVRIGEREVAEGDVSLLRLTRGRVVPLASMNDEGNANVQGAVGGIDIIADDETQAIVADKPNRLRKKSKAADGASGSGLPPKKLREDHSVSGDVSASTTGKSLVFLQGLFDRSTLAAEIGATIAATLLFVTSFVTPTPEREGGGHGDSVTGPNLRTQLASESFVVLTDSFHLSSTHATDDEVTFIVRSSMSPPPVLTAAVATTIIADVTSAPAPRADTRQVPPSNFRDFASIGEANQDIASPSHPVGTELFTDSFFVSQDVDSETLHQIYIPKWNVNNDSALDDTDICHGVIDYLAPPVLFSQLRSMDYEQLFAEFNVGTARQSCLSSEVRLRLEHELRGRKKFEDKCAMQAGWLKEKDAEIAMLIEIMPKNIINIF
ncbi:hypothetical protein Tco_1569650 [Tanacetum coccineum]